MKRAITLILLFLIPIIGATVFACTEALASGGNGTRESATCGETSEMHLAQKEGFTPWLLDQSIFDEDQGDRTEVRQVVEKDVKTVKLANVVPPIHFRQGEADIPDEYLELLRGVLDDMRERENLRLHFVGHADSQPLSDALQEKYGDNVGLSRERAGTTAEYCQRALGLPPEAISYEGLGDSQPIADNETEAGQALNRRVEVEVWYDEIGEKLVDKEVIVPRQVNRIKVCRTETVCKLRYKEGHSHRARVKNLIAPLHYEEGMVKVPEGFIHQIDQVLKNLRSKNNIVVKFIAFTDNTPLAGRNKRIYGNHLGLSKAVARRVSLAVRENLGSIDFEVDSDGKGATRPVASNDTPQGRSMNRRVEVEFWHDDPLQDLPDEPQLCPEEAGAETITKIYDPPGGNVSPILFDKGDPVLPPDYIDRLSEIMDEIGDKANVRLRFIGYLSNERLDRRTAAIYGDDIGWSTARARRAMSLVSEQMGLTEAQTEFEGHGYVQTMDVVNAGFIETGTSRVKVEAIYDELVDQDDYEGVDITRMTREVKTGNPFGLNLMRISVDGKPLDDPGKSIPDVQRCTDVALDDARIEFKYDNLKTTPRLNVTAWPLTIRYRDLEETEFAENQVNFRLYVNYHSFINRAEVRIFEDKQSVRDTPVAVIAMNDNGLAQWHADYTSYSAPGRKLKYLVRVYDAGDHFDETTTQSLWIVDQIDPDAAEADLRKELLAGYGESRIASRNIDLSGGTVQAIGNAIPEGHSVWLAGNSIPVDGNGRFIAEEILPVGMHTVEVAVLDKSGNGELFLRDLSLEKNDWFTVGIGDLTLSGNTTDSSAELLAPDKQQYKDEANLQGRLAFYTKGKFGSGWELTASADTREGPLDEIFSNFLDKSPEALFRRIDPDYHMPTYGDDGTVVEDAPTNGKFYAKLKKKENYGLWGNFKIGYTENDLAHVDRGLYGANLHYQTNGITEFGEQRFMADGFAADPGTVAGRDEFRGTGGSLYFLNRQDLLEGSERVRIEIRDKDSGMVLGVKNLTPTLDYDLDYLQGRLLLVQPLSSTADDSLLVHSDSAAGNPLFLVVRYEYTPGVEELDTMATGGSIHYWFNDHVKIGVTTNRDEEAGSESSLDGADITLRESPNTWLKIEAGRSKGSSLSTTNSQDGGFNFESTGTFDDSEDAAAHRVDVSIGLSDIFESRLGKITLYNQDLEAGYAAPGLNTDRDTSQFGGTVELPIGERFKMRIKADNKTVDQGLETEAAELNLDFHANDHWTLSPGVRRDSREDNSPVVPLTQDEGDRTDVVVKALYDSGARWNGYGFAQESLQTTGNREKNGRFGVGGIYRITDRFSLEGEGSGGNLGTDVRLGTEYLYSDRTTLYANYALENERTDNGLRARKGNMVSGFRTRYSDSASVYLEEHYVHGNVPTGLMHSTGVDLAPMDHLNFGANIDFGTLRNNQTGAELERMAAGIRAGYGLKRLKINGALEYRVDDAEQPDTTTIKRTSWLLKNSLKYQLNPDWRLIGKLNYAQSDSSQGEFFDGSYTEAVLGYAYRPIHHDRLNALLKYTYFYNVPAAGQIVSTSPGADVIQRSHIASADVMYDLTSRMTLGGKYAYRLGQVSQERVNPEFFDSRASLYIIRADWHVIHRWDALIEGRLLDLPDAQDSLSGALLGVYRHIGNHIKLGIGYNFSKFSDDLTDLSYDHQGLFINLVGKI